MTTANTLRTSPLGTISPAATKIGHLLRGQVLARRYPHCHTPPTPGKATQPPATSPSIARQQAIENALSMALHFIRHGDSPDHLKQAAGRAIRAASMLKQACAECATALTVGA